MATKEKKKSGRKPELTPEVQETICRVLKATMSKSTAARAAGKEPGTVCVWLARGQKARESKSRDPREQRFIEFNEAYTRAWNDSLAECEETYRRGAITGFKTNNTKTIIAKDKVQIIKEEHEIPPDMGALRHILACANPDKWSAKRAEERALDELSEHEKSIQEMSRLYSEAASKTVEEQEFYAVHMRWPSEAELKDYLNAKR